MRNTLRWLGMVLLPVLMILFLGVPAHVAHTIAQHVAHTGPAGVTFAFAGVASYVANHLRTRSERRLVNFAPGVTTPTLVTLDSINNKKCLPIAQFRQYIAGFMKSTGTGGVTEFKLIAATADDGTGNTPIIAHALTFVPDQVGEYVWLECEEEQVREVLAGATHIGVEITLSTGTDKATIFFERAKPMFPQDQLTADNAT